MVGDSQYDHLSYDELHGLCKARGFCRKDAKTVLKTRLEAMDSVEKKCIVEQTDKMDTSCSVLGKRERALSDPAVLALPTQDGVGKRSRGDAGASHVMVDLAVLEKHTQWWSSELKPHFNLWSHSLVDGSENAISAWMAEECNRVLGQELTPDEELQCPEMVQDGKERELNAWKQFNVFSSVDDGSVTKKIIDSRWVLTWKMVDGVKKVKARLVAKGFQDPDLTEGLVDTSGCVSLRSSHLQVISLSALQKWKLWSLDIKNAFLQADGFDRAVFLRAPDEWNPGSAHRIWKLNAPAYGLNDAPVAFRRSLKRHLMNSTLSMDRVGLKCIGSSFDPCLFFVFRKTGSAVGAFTTHIDDILGCGEPGVMDGIRTFLELRFGELKSQEGNFVHVGMELVQDSTFRLP